VVAHSLNAEGHDASEDGTGRGTPLVISPTLTSPDTGGRRDKIPISPDLSSVRRLTPIEAERLQGFPDGFTCLCGAGPDWRACSCADSPRYRALGNAVTVDVVEWISRRLANVSRVRPVGPHRAVHLLP
jgi:DNA (cytosine-5)-methyltransferase 1